MGLKAAKKVPGQPIEEVCVPIFTPSAEDLPDFSEDLPVFAADFAEKMQITGCVTTDPSKNLPKTQFPLKKRPTSTINPLTGDGFQALLRSYYGHYYLTRASKAFGIPKATLSAIVHQGRTMRPNEVRKFQQLLPKILKDMLDWVEVQKSHYDTWGERQKLRVAETSKFLTHMEREAERIAAAKRRSPGP